MKKKYLFFPLFIFFISFHFFADDYKQMQKEKDELIEYIISCTENEKSDITLFESENIKSIINLNIIYDDVLAAESLYLQHRKLDSDNYDKFMKRNFYIDYYGFQHTYDSSILLEIKPFILSHKYSLESVLYYYRGIASFLRGEEETIFKKFFEKAIELNDGFYQAKLFLILLTNSQTLTNLVEINELHDTYAKFNTAYFFTNKGSYKYKKAYSDAFYSEYFNLYLLLARCAKKEKKLRDMDSYYDKAFRKTDQGSELEKLLSDEWNESYDSFMYEVAVKKGFKSIQEYKNYKQRISPENLTRFLQIGNCNPFVLGDVIEFDSVSSYKIRVAQVTKKDDYYEFLVGYYRPESFSKYCYILSKDDLTGIPTLKYIGNKDYTVFDTYGSKYTINTYVFERID